MGEGAGEGAGKVEVTLEDVKAAVAVLKAWLRQQREVERLLRDLRHYAGSSAYADPLKQIIAEAVARQYSAGRREEEEGGEAEIDEETLESLKRKAEEIERMLKRAQPL
jgi:predicted amidohydrolase